MEEAITQKPIHNRILFGIIDLHSVNFWIGLVCGIVLTSLVVYLK